MHLREWPKQGSLRGKRVIVIFNYEMQPQFGGTVIRNDHEEPWYTIISLDDGRVVLATECQFTFGEVTNNAPVLI